MRKRSSLQLRQRQSQFRSRVTQILEMVFHGNQSAMARALGVSHSLINMIVRGVQPPTPNLMARLGAAPGVNPDWVATGEGVPIWFVEDAALPVSGTLIATIPFNPLMLSRERVRVAREYERESCYFWRVPEGHAATLIGAWRVLPDDLFLIETNAASLTHATMLVRRKCVIDGRCLDQSEPLFGEVSEDSAGNLIFSDSEPRLRFDDLSSSGAPRPSSKSNVLVRKRRTIRSLEPNQEKPLAKYSPDRLPTFSLADVRGYQLLMLRPPLSPESTS